MNILFRIRCTEKEMRASVNSSLEGFRLLLSGLHFRERERENSARQKKKTIYGVRHTIGRSSAIFTHFYRQPNLFHFDD